MTRYVYAVERKEKGTWTVVAGRVFETRDDAEAFREKYVETDVSGRERSVNLRVTEYRVIE